MMQKEKYLPLNVTVSGLDNSICTYGGIMSYSTGQALQPLNNATSGNGSLRVLLINSCVPRNTKALIAHVKENRINLMPKVRLLLRVLLH